YGTTSLVGQRPRKKTPRVTAGLQCPPETWPPAYTITITAESMASGAITPAPLITTVQPIVSTRKNVPMNSVRYLFIGCLHSLKNQGDVKLGSKEGGSCVPNKYMS